MKNIGISSVGASFVGAVINSILNFRLTVITFAALAVLVVNTGCANDRCGRGHGGRVYRGELVGEGCYNQGGGVTRTVYGEPQFLGRVGYQSGEDRHHVNIPGTFRVDIKCPGATPDQKMAVSKEAFDRFKDEGSDEEIRAFVCERLGDGAQIQVTRSQGRPEVSTKHVEFPRSQWRRINGHVPAGIRHRAPATDRNDNIDDDDNFDEDSVRRDSSRNRRTQRGSAGVRYATLPDGNVIPTMNSQEYYETLPYVYVNSPDTVRRAIQGERQAERDGYANW